MNNLCIDIEVNVFRHFSVSLPDINNNFNLKTIIIINYYLFKCFHEFND
jgi:hypothetical protein